MKKKILVLTTTYPRWLGDVEPAFVHNLSVELSHYYDVHVLAPFAKGSVSKETLDGVKVRRFRYLPFAWQGLCYDGGIVPKLKSQPLRALEIPFLLFGMLLHGIAMVRREKIHLIHAHWVIPQGFIALCIKLLTGGNVKVLVTSHGTDVNALNHPLIEAIKRWVWSQADVITAVSQALVRRCQSIIGRDNAVDLAPMGVDCRHTFVVSVDNDQRSGLVCVGRLIESKGVVGLLEAFIAFNKLYPNQKMTFVGDGPQRKVLEEMVCNAGLGGRVEFTGSVSSPEVAKYFNQARIAVMPSLVEGLGLVAAEAIACGCITLVSDIDAIQDVHHEKALQFVAGDANSLLERLCFVAENPALAEQLSAALKQHVVETYDWQAVGERYHQLITNCLVK